MAQSGHGDAGYGNRKGGAPGHPEGRSEKEKRSKDTVLDETRMGGGESEASTQHHRTDEGAGEVPEGASADLDGPEADGHHHKKMVKTGEGVHEARFRGGTHALCVEHGGVSRERECGTEKKQEGEATFHWARW